MCAPSLTRYASGNGPPARLRAGALRGLPRQRTGDGAGRGSGDAQRLSSGAPPRMGRGAPGVPAVRRRGPTWDFSWKRPSGGRPDFRFDMGAPGLECGRSRCHGPPHPSSTCSPATSPSQPQPPLLRAAGLTWPPSPADTLSIVTAGLGAVRYLQSSTLVAQQKQLHVRTVAGGEGGALHARLCPLRCPDASNSAACLHAGRSLAQQPREVPG